MNIQSTARRINRKNDKSLAELAERSDVNVAVESNLVEDSDRLGKESITLESGMKVIPLALGKNQKPPALRKLDGALTATTGVLSFADLGLETYAESMHESAEAPLDILLTIVTTGKAISTIEKEGFASWKTAIDVASVGAGAFTALGHVAPSLAPYATSAKLVRFLLQSASGIYEIALAVDQSNEFQG